MCRMMHSSARLVFILTFAMEAAVTIAACEGPVGEQISSESVPDVPSWAVDLLGEKLRSTFSAEGHCLGNTENVQMRYTGATPGVKVVGWGWDPAGKQPPPRVILVGPDYTIVGAGQPGTDRPDVPKSRPEITSSNTGFSAVTKLTKGSVDVFGI